MGIQWHNQNAIRIYFLAICFKYYKGHDKIHPYKQISFQQMPELILVQASFETSPSGQ